MTAGVTVRWSVKSGNIAWLCSLLILDVLAMLVFIYAGASNNIEPTRVAVVRGLLAVVLPVIVLLLSAVLSPSVKASLVYWKGKEALPGHEAFTRHGPADPRVDMNKLGENVGVLPSDTTEQNALWYRLYREVSGEVTVFDAHRNYLLFRDMAAMSVLLTFIVPLPLYLSEAQVCAIWFAVALFMLQYIITAIAARHSGIRLVTNVLAIHCSRIAEDNTKAYPQKT